MLPDVQFEIKYFACLIMGFTEFGGSLGEIVQHLREIKLKEDCSLNTNYAFFICVLNPMKFY